MYMFGLGISSFFAALLGILVALTFIAGLIKVAINKHVLKKKIRLANLEAANKQTDCEKLVGPRELDEGDLFGVRAIQAGFFGGVTQSCPNSPSPSRSSSLASQELIVTERDSLNLSPKPSSHRLEPPKPTCYNSQARRKSSTSSQNSTSSRRENVSSESGNLQYFGSSTVKKPHFEQILRGGLPIDPLTSKVSSSPGKNALIVPVTPEPTLKSTSASNLSFQDSDSSRDLGPSQKNRRNRSPSLTISSRSPGIKPPLLRVSSDNVEKSKRDEFLSEVSISLNNLPRLASPAIIRDSVGSKQQVLIPHSNDKSHHPSNEKSLHNQSTLSTLSSRTSVVFQDSEKILATSSSTNNKNMSNQISTHQLQRNPSKDLGKMLKKTEISDNRELKVEKEVVPQNQHNRDSGEARESLICDSYTNSLSSRSSMSSTFAYQKISRSGESELSPFAQRSSELSSQDEFYSHNHQSRITRAFMDDFYDTYYN